jgi:membrane-associated phospholipid phosphatase
VSRLIGPIGLYVPSFMDSTPLWDRGVKFGNDLAAFPSLHEGMTVLIGIVFWSCSRWWIRVLLVAYPLAMAWALVYSGEHYVVDLVGGALAAAGVAFAANRLTMPKRRLATLLAWTSVR